MASRQPRAKVSRPENRLIVAAKANQIAPAWARSPHSRRTIRVKRITVPITASEPITRKPSQAPSGGESRE